MKRLLTLAALALAAGCGPSTIDENKDGVADGVRVPDTVSVVAPSSPVGTVSGRVLTTKFEPIEGAVVQLVLGGHGEGAASSFKGASDTDGTFAFKNVPAGASAQLFVSKQGFGAVRTNVVVPGAAGNFPLNDGNANVGSVLLLELNGSVRFNVMTETGKPAAGVKALLEVAPVGFISTSGTGYGSSQGQLSVEGTVDAQGQLTFSGVPSPQELARVWGNSTAYTLTLGALDEDADGRIDFVSASTSYSYSGNTLFTRPPPTIFLQDWRDTPGNLTVVASNVDTLVSGYTNPMRNALKPADSIHVVFNQPIVEATLQVRVVEEDCATPVTVTKTVRADKMAVTLSPQTSWELGKEYNIAIRATGTDSGYTMSRVGFFFGADPQNPVSLAATARFDVRKATGNTNNSYLQSGDELFLTFSTPLRWVGGGAGRVFFNTDLNGDNQVGNATGCYAEFGCPFNTGFGISNAEPLSDPANGTFTCSQSSYTSRWRVTYFGLPAAGVPMNTSVRVTIPKDTTTTDGFQTIWGQPFSGDVSGSVTLAP